MRVHQHILSTFGAILALALSTPSFAQDKDPCEEEGACRFLKEWVYEDPEGEVVRLPIGYDLPWVTQGNVLLTPGETVIVTLAEVDGALEPQLARAGEAAEDTALAEGEIRFTFSDITRGRVTLTVLSNYSEPLEYAALKVNPQTGPDRTSVCTLMPGVTVFEMWQEPIYQLALWTFRPAEGYSCSVIQVGDEEADSGNDAKTK